MSAQHQELPVREVSIDAMRDDRLSARQDLVVVEEPLEIRIAQAGDTGPGTSMSITMRTPGQDIELAVGFLHGEGIVRSREDIADSRICGPVGNVVRIQLAEGAAHDPAPPAAQLLYDLELRRLRQRVARRGRAHAALVERRRDRSRCRPR